MLDNINFDSSSIIIHIGLLHDYQIPVYILHLIPEQPAKIYARYGSQRVTRKGGPDKYVSEAIKLCGVLVGVIRSDDLMNATIILGGLLIQSKSWSGN